MAVGGPDCFWFAVTTTTRGNMTHVMPKAVELGQPEEKPDIVVEPLFDPVPREVPHQAPKEKPVKTPKREPVPA